MHNGPALIPLCWPTPGGACACGYGHEDKNIGKAPLIMAGARHHAAAATAG
jgi:hypothetical protein